MDLVSLEVLAAFVPREAVEDGLRRTWEWISTQQLREAEPA